MSVIILFNDVECLGWVGDVFVIVCNEDVSE